MLPERAEMTQTGREGEQEAAQRLQRNVGGSGVSGPRGTQLCLRGRPHREC